MAPDPAGEGALANALTLYRTGRYAEAEAVCRDIIQRDPTQGLAWERLGHIATRTGRPAEAIAYYEEAILHLADPAEAHNNLAVALHERGDLHEALPHYRRAVALGLQHALLHSNLGCLLRDLGHLQDGVDELRRAVEMDPQLAHGHSNLGVTLCLQARADLALPHLRLATALYPEWGLGWSNLLFCLNYVDTATPEQLAAAHRVYGRRFAEPSHRPRGDPSPERRLRVGLVSPDLKQHSVTYFLEPLLAAHDRERIEYVAYANVVRPDAVTLRLQEHVERWRSIYGLSDEDAARLIFADRIDILIDLAGHTANNRLALLARRPAPVSMTYLGYANTTGLPMVDWRLTDAWADPPGLTEGQHSEELLRIPGGFLFYRPRQPSPPPAPSPAVTSGGVTFGSFNLLAKISPTVLTLWGRILKRVRGSRLVLKGPGFTDPRTRAEFEARLADTELAGQDVQLLPHVSDEGEHLSMYAKIDIALDTWPYHGTTTTCEALWMGVPVVTLAGRTHASRVGVSLLNRVGLSTLVANSPDEYVSIASDLAADLPRLAALRESLRGRVTASGLTDAVAGARAFEQTLFDAWHVWCRREQARARQPPAGTALLPMTGDLLIAAADTLEQQTPYVLLEQPDGFEAEGAFTRLAARRGDRIVDVGADHGVYCLPLAARVGSAGRVWAFEADPTVAERLRLSIAANALDNVVLVPATPVDGGTLEDSARAMGIRDVAFVRLAEGGTEAPLFAGDGGFFARESPLVMLGIRPGADRHHAAVSAMARLGYQPYRLLPGLELLAPWAADGQLDPYQRNLFACKPERAAKLEERGLLARTVAAAEEAPAGTWVTHLRPLTIARAIGAGWRGARDERERGYFSALDHYALAHRVLEPPVGRLAHLMKAAELASAALSETITIPALQTVARVAWEAGFRAIAVEALHVLIERCQSPGEVGDLKEDLPFLPANPRFDGLAPLDGDMRGWVLAGALEQRERLRTHSSYESANDPETLTCLQTIADLGYHSAEMARRIDLIKQRRGLR